MHCFAFLSMILNDLNMFVNVSIQKRTSLRCYDRSLLSRFYAFDPHTYFGILMTTYSFELCFVCLSESRRHTLFASANWNIHDINLQGSDLHVDRYWYFHFFIHVLPDDSTTPLFSTHLCYILTYYWYHEQLCFILIYHICVYMNPAIVYGRASF